MCIISSFINIQMSETASPRRIRKLKMNASIGDASEILEQIYKGEERRFLSVAKDKIKPKTQKQVIAREVKEVVSNIFQRLTAKASFSQNLNPIPVNSIDEDDREKLRPFKKTSMKIDTNQKVNERMQTFGKDPNAFYVYKQRSGFVKIVEERINKALFRKLKEQAKELEKELGGQEKVVAEEIKEVEVGEETVKEVVEEGGEKNE